MNVGKLLKVIIICRIYVTILETISSTVPVYDYPGGKTHMPHPEITYACIQFIKYCLEKQLICKVISYAKITYTQMLNKMSQISFSLRWLEVALSQSEHRLVSKGRKGQMWSRCFPRMISQPICIQEYIFPIQNQHTWLKKWVVIF